MIINNQKIEKILYCFTADGPVKNLSSSKPFRWRETSSEVSFPVVPGAPGLVDLKRPWLWLWSFPSRSSSWIYCSSLRPSIRYSLFNLQHWIAYSLALITRRCFCCWKIVTCLLAIPPCLGHYTSFNVVWKLGCVICLMRIVMSWASLDEYSHATEFLRISADFGFWSPFGHILCIKDKLHDFPVVQYAGYWLLVPRVH